MSLQKSSTIQIEFLTEKDSRSYADTDRTNAETEDVETEATLKKMV